MLSSASRTFATKAPVRVAITGAAGAIGYALAFRVASGQMLGPDQPVILHLVKLIIKIYFFANEKHYFRYNF
jgi:hypothetical protein